MIDKFIARFLKRGQKGETDVHEIERPTLEAYVGQELVFHMLEQDESTIITRQLYMAASNNGFYLKNGGSGYALYHWDWQDPGSKAREATFAIYDREGNEVYRNEDVPFDATNARRH